MTTKQHSNFPETNSKEMEICDLPNKEFKRVVLRKLGELQENTERQFYKIRKTTYTQNKKFNTGVEIIRKNQTEILGLKNTMNEMKNANGQLAHAEAFEHQEGKACILKALPFTGRQLSTSTNWVYIGIATLWKQRQ